MQKRVVINGQLSLGTALIVTFIFGGIATFGLMILYVAAREGVYDWIFLGIAVLVAILFWAVLGVLWSALGVWMIITSEGVRTIGAFGSRRYPAQGLQVGLFKKRLSTGRVATRDRRHHKGEQLWMRAAGDKPRLVAEGLESDPLFVTITRALEDVLGVTAKRLEVDTSRVIIKPDFSPFDKADTQ